MKWVAVTNCNIILLSPLRIKFTIYKRTMNLCRCITRTFPNPVWNIFGPFHLNCDTLCHGSFQICSLTALGQSERPRIDTVCPGFLASWLLRVNQLLWSCKKLLKPTSATSSPLSESKVLLWELRETERDPWVISRAFSHRSLFYDTINSGQQLLTWKL